MSLIDVAEWTAFIFALFLIRKDNEPRARWMILLLGLELLTETIAGFYQEAFGNNHIVYNISIPVHNLIYAFMISRVILRPRNRRKTLQLMIGYLVFVIINMAFVQGIERYNSYSSIAGTAMLCGLTIIYFTELVKAERIIRLRAEPLFWICTALMLIGIPRSVFFSVFEYMVFSETLVKDFGATFKTVNELLCVIFYSMLSYAFVCRLIFRTSARTNMATDPALALPLPDVHSQKEPGPAFS